MDSMMQKTETMLYLDGQMAADLMVPDPISIRSDAGATDAMILFTEKGISAAPVIDKAGRPIGVISRSDLLVHQAEQAKHAAGRPQYVFEPGRPTEEKSDSARATVADLMTPAVFAVSPDTPVQRVVSDMVGLHVHRLFVVDEVGVLVGVITTMDVLKHLKPE